MSGKLGSFQSPSAFAPWLFQQTLMSESLLGVARTSKPPFFHPETEIRGRCSVVMRATHVLRRKRCPKIATSHWVCSNQLAKVVRAPIVHRVRTRNARGNP